MTPPDRDPTAEAARRTEAEYMVEAWAGCVRRLMAVAPTSALKFETGVSGPSSTPPDRRALRAAALQVVEQWLARDLEKLEAHRG